MTLWNTKYFDYFPGCILQVTLNKRAFQKKTTSNLNKQKIKKNKKKKQNYFEYENNNNNNTKNTRGGHRLIFLI